MQNLTANCKILMNFHHEKFSIDSKSPLGTIQVLRHQRGGWVGSGNGIF